MENNAQHYASQIKDTVQALRGHLSDQAGQAAPQIDTWIEATKGVGLGQISQQLEKLKQSVQEGNLNTIRGTLQQLGTLTTQQSKTVDGYLQVELSQLGSALTAAADSVGGPSEHIDSFDSNTRADAGLSDVPSASKTDTSQRPTEQESTSTNEGVATANVGSQTGGMDAQIGTFSTGPSPAGTIEAERYRN